MAQHIEAAAAFFVLGTTVTLVLLISFLQCQIMIAKNREEIEEDFISVQDFTHHESKTALLTMRMEKFHRDVVKMFWRNYTTTELLARLYSTVETTKTEVEEIELRVSDLERYEEKFDDLVLEFKSLKLRIKEVEAENYKRGRLDRALKKLG